jgi:hypothetical protein
MTSKSGAAGRNCSTKRWKRPSRRAILPRSPGRTWNGNDDQQRMTVIDELAVGAVTRELFSEIRASPNVYFRPKAEVWPRGIYL